jgi:hypothetical protein
MKIGLASPRDKGMTAHGLGIKGYAFNTVRAMNVGREGIFDFPYSRCGIKCFPYVKLI